MSEHDNDNQQDLTDLGEMGELNIDLGDLGDGSLNFLEETGEVVEEKTWTILIIDDDLDVHQSTKFALDNMTLFGRKAKFHSAYSGHEGWEKLNELEDVAVIFLDVVMESESAGLDLAKKIRQHEKFKATRIILRTGQPGYAPELQVIENYDINDYRTKSELTANKLVSALLAALRAYQQIKELEQAQDTLRKITDSTIRMSQEYDPYRLAKKAIREAEYVFGDNSKTVIVLENNGRILGITKDLLKFDKCDALSELENQNPGCDVASRMLALALKSNVGEEIKMEKESIAMKIDLGIDQGAVWCYPENGLNIIEDSLLPVWMNALAGALKNAFLQEDLEQFAFFDPITGLPNRSRLIMQAEQMAQLNQSNKAVAFIDIDGFSAINDAFGYEAGDEVLKVVARRLVETFPQFMVARMPGGAFGLLGPRDLMSEEFFMKGFEAPIKARDWEFNLKISVGMAQVVHQKSAHQTLNEANMALNASKKTQGECRYIEHNKNLTEQVQSRLRLSKELKQALINRKGLRLFYQPQMDLETGELIGLEALARWFTKDDETISPTVFIPLAESTGLISLLGHWALTEACEQSKRWEDSGFKTVIGVNVSALQLQDDTFYKQIEEIFEKTGVDPSTIELEITESNIMKDPERTLVLLEKIKQKGVRISVDDFGTGYSNLSQLERLPMDRIKLDRSFVIPLGSGDRGEHIARLVANLSHQLGVDCLAEGVESSEQVDELRKLGVREAQGWLFAPALSPEKVIPWINDYREAFESAKKGK